MEITIKIPGLEDRSEEAIKIRNLMKVFSLAEQEGYMIVGGKKIFKRDWIAKRAEEIKASARATAEWEWETFQYGVE